METYITKIINTILFHMWTCVIVTSTDLGLNSLQPTTPRDNLAVSKAVFIADVIFETALFYVIMQSLAGSRFSGGSLHSRLSAAARLILKLYFYFQMPAGTPHSSRMTHSKKQKQKLSNASLHIFLKIKHSVICSTFDLPIILLIFNSFYLFI